MRSRRREIIVRTLKCSSRPHTVADLAEELDLPLSSVSILCAVMALEGRIARRNIAGGAWFGKSGSVFNRRDYWLQRQKPANQGNRGWVTFWMLRSERGAKAMGYQRSRVWECPIRLVYQGEILHQWNVKEEQLWLAGKRTLRTLKTMLRDPSRSPSAASTPAHSSPQ